MFFFWWLLLVFFGFFFAPHTHTHTHKKLWNLLVSQLVLLNVNVIDSFVICPNMYLATSRSLVLGQYFFSVMCTWLQQDLWCWDSTFRCHWMFLWRCRPLKTSYSGVRKSMKEFLHTVVRFAVHKVVWNRMWVHALHTVLRLLDRAKLKGNSIGSKESMLSVS